MVGLTSVPIIADAPEPAAPPVMPPGKTGAGQLYVVPAGTTPLVTLTGVTEKAVPLHADAVMGVIVAQEGVIVKL